MEPQPPSVVAALQAASGPAVIPPRLFPPSAKLAVEAAAAAAGATPQARRWPGHGLAREQESETGGQGRDQEQLEAKAPDRDQRLRVQPPAVSAGAQGECSSPLAPQASDSSKRQRRSSRAARPQSEMLRRYLTAPDD
jgi:hypothetical protein